MKSFSIKTQILLLTLALVSLSLAFLIVITVIQIKNQFHEDTEQRAISHISVLASNLGFAMESSDIAYVDDIIAGALTDDDIIGICICGKVGKREYLNGGENIFNNVDFPVPFAPTRPSFSPSEKPIERSENSV